MSCKPGKLICAPICFQWVTDGTSEENSTAEAPRRGENEHKSESAEEAEVTWATPDSMVKAVGWGELTLAWQAEACPTKAGHTPVQTRLPAALLKHAPRPALNNSQFIRGGTKARLRARGELRADG